MGKVVPLNAQQQGTALTVAEAVEENTVKLLRRYLRERGRPRQGPLFESRNGTRLSYSMAWRLFRKYADSLQDNGQPAKLPAPSDYEYAHRHRLSGVGSCAISSSYNAGLSCGQTNRLH